jgi:hypothetical protein
MPASAYGLVALFTVVAVACGAGAARLVGPRSWRAAVIPSAAAFLALYLVGHRSGLEMGPTVELLGFRVAIVQDLVVAVVAAGVAALAQRLLLDVRRGRDAATREAR